MMSMISELVDRLRVESKSMGKYGVDYMATLLMRSADTIEMLSKKVREPKNGKWIYQFRDSENEEYRCSECDYPTMVKHNYCPNCGADMRGK